MELDDILYFERYYDEFSSSNIMGFQYKGDTLIVDFISGSRYRYEGVPTEVVAGWVKAGSKGRYHAREIKWVFPYHQIY